MTQTTGNGNKERKRETEQIAATDVTAGLNPDPARTHPRHTKQRKGHDTQHKEKRTTKIDLAAAQLRRGPEEHTPPPPARLTPLEHQQQQSNPTTRQNTNHAGTPKNQDTTPPPHKKTLKTKTGTDPPPHMPHTTGTT